MHVSFGLILHFDGPKIICRILPVGLLMHGLSDHVARIAQCVRFFIGLDIRGEQTEKAKTQCEIKTTHHIDDD